MGQWVVRTTPPRELDMPGPRALVRERALPGWVWQTTQGERMELIRYSPDIAVWKDPQGKIIEVKADTDGTRTSVEA